jgi:protein-S-isoprenylcysteine O-methyltransferase Ste14
MNEEESKAKLRKLVPWIVGAIFVLLGSSVFLIKSEQPRLWPLVVGDLVFTSALLFFLWRALGRRR